MSMKCALFVLLGTTASAGRGAAEGVAAAFTPTYAPTFSAMFPTAGPTIDCGGGYDCPSTTTCCKTNSNQWGCCAMADGVCCSDHVHCCPKSHPVCGGTPAKPTCATDSDGATIVAEWRIAARRIADDGAAAARRAAAAAAAPATAPARGTMDALDARLSADAAPSASDAAAMPHSATDEARRAQLWAESQERIAQLRIEARANVGARHRARRAAEREATRAAKRARRA